MASLATLRGEGVPALVPTGAVALLLLAGVWFDGGNGSEARAFLFVLALPVFYFAWKGRLLELSRLLREPVSIVFLLFLLACCLSLIPSADRYTTLDWCARYASFYLIFLSAASMRGSARRALLYGAIVFSAVLLGLVGLYDFFSGTGFSYVRLAPSFFAHNAFGGYLLAPLALLVAFACSARQRWLVLLYGGGSVFLGAIFVLTFSRGSWLALALAALVAGYLFWGTFREALAQHGKLVGTILLGATLLITGALALEERLASSVGQEARIWSGETIGQNAATARLHYFADALTLIETHPFLGVGLGHYGEAVKLYKTTPAYYTSNPHNAYLGFAAGIGLAGGILFSLLIFLTLVQVWRLSRMPLPPGERIFVALLSTGFIAIAVHSGMDVDWTFGANALLYLLIAGLLFSFPTVPRAQRAGLGSIGFVLGALLGLVLLAYGVAVALAGTASARGEALATHDEFGAAAVAYLHAARYVPWDPANYFNAAIMLDRLAGVTADPAEKRQDILAAGMEMDRAIALKPRRALFWSWKASFFMEIGDYAAAEKAYEETIRNNPTESVFEYDVLAALYNKDKRYAEVIALAPRALAYYPQSLYDNPYWVHPDKPAVWRQLGDLSYQLGVAYLKTKEGALARGAFEEALVYDPSHVSAKAALKSLPK
jgi:O-antigen ligase